MRGKCDERAGRAAGHVAPDRLAGGSESGVGKRHAECLGDHLRRGGGPQKLAAAAGAGAGPAAQFGGLGQSEFAMSVAGADRLDLAGIFAFPGRQGHSARHEHAGQCFEPARAIIIAGSPLSQVAIPSTPLRRGSERIKRRKTMAASLR